MLCQWHTVWSGERLECDARTRRTAHLRSFASARLACLCCDLILVVTTGCSADHVQVNLALKKLPDFKCLPGASGQAAGVHHGTVHLLPQGQDVIGSVRNAFSSAQRGELPEWPTMEMYFHTPLDPSLQDAEGHHSSALFVQWVPYQPKVRQRSDCRDSHTCLLIRLERACFASLPSVCNVIRVQLTMSMIFMMTEKCDNILGFWVAAEDPLTRLSLLQGSSWEVEEDKYVDHLLRLVDEFAPGTRDSVADTFTLTPPGIERHFGIARGHIHHVDNSIGFDQRFPYRLPTEGLYSCSAGCFPAGSVIGAAGHNAANSILEDLGIRQGAKT